MVVPGRCLETACLPPSTRPAGTDPNLTTHPIHRVRYGHSRGTDIAYGVVPGHPELDFQPLAPG
eukprot:3636780-Rhodomonas_salina.1